MTYPILRRYYNSTSWPRLAKRPKEKIESSSIINCKKILTFVINTHITYYYYIYV